MPQKSYTTATAVRIFAGDLCKVGCYPLQHILFIAKCAAPCRTYKGTTRRAKEQPNVAHGRNSVKKQDPVYKRDLLPSRETLTRLVERSLRLAESL